MRSLKLFLAYVAVLAVAAAPAAAQVASQEPYHPGEEVRRYHYYDFELSAEYGKQVGFYRTAPVLVIGFLLTIFLACWSCVRCCKICPCCDCLRAKHDMSTKWKIILTAIAIGLGISSVVLIIVGLEANDYQTDAFQGVPGLINNLVDWKDDTVTELRNVADAIIALGEHIGSLSGQIPGLDTGDVNSTLASITTALDDIEAQTNETALEDLRDSFSDQATEINDARSYMVKIILGILLGLVLIQLLFAMLDTYGPKYCKPKKVLCCITPFLTIAFVLMMFLVWFLSAFLLTTTTFFADFCIDPDTIIMNLTNTEDNDVVKFYLLCDDPNLGIANPLQSELATIQTAISDLSTEISTLETDASAACGGGCPASVTAEIALTSSLLTAIEVAIGVDANNDGDFESGLFAQLSCSALNGQYQALLNVLCDDFFKSLAGFFETMMGFAVVMFFAECIRRIIYSKNEEEEKDEPPMPPPYMDAPAYDAQGLPQYSSDGKPVAQFK